MRTLFSVRSYIIRATMSDSDEEEMLQYKIILLGDGTVGKTSIAMRFTNDTFGQAYKQVPVVPLGAVAHN